MAISYRRECYSKWIPQKIESSSSEDGEEEEEEAEEETTKSSEEFSRKRSPLIVEGLQSKL